MSTRDDARATQLRRCASCAQPQVACVHVTEHLLNGVLPIGRTYAHECRGCRKRFTTESVLRSLVELCFGGMLLLFGGGFVAVFVSMVLPALVDGSMAFELPSLHQLGIGALFIAMAIAGAYLLTRSLVRWFHVFRNPVA